MSPRTRWLGGASVLGLAALMGILARPAASPEPAPKAAARAAAPEPAAPVVHDVAPPAEPSKAPDPERVRAAFEKFQAAVKDITKEKLEEEQARMTAALEAAKKTPTPEPVAEPTVDENGLRWTKLTYPSGEVRYEFPTE